MFESQASPKRITAQRPFFSCGPNDDRLFSVRADVPLSDALEQASCFLAAALSAVYEAADDAGNASVHGAAYLVEMSKAVVDAAILAIVKEGPHSTGRVFNEIEGGEL